MNLLQKITFIITRLLLIQIRCLAITLNDSIPIKKYILLENEKISSLFSLSSFPLDNQNQQDQRDIEFPLIELKQNIMCGNIMIKNLKSIIIDNDQLAIMTIYGDEMICLLQLKRYLVNDELSYLNCSISFKLQQQNCFKVYQISNDQLVILCQKDSKTIKLYLQNLQNQVISDYEVKIMENCKFNSFHQDQYIIIFQSDCINQIDNTQQLNILKINQNEIQSYYQQSLTQLLQIINIEKAGKLIDIQICHSKNIIFEFTKGIFQCNIDNLNQCYQIKFIIQSSTIVKTFNYCLKSYILEYTNEGEWFFKKYQIYLNTTDYVDSIQIQNKLIIYSKDELIIFFNPSILNKKQIQVQFIIPIADLSYFALLNIKGELQIYKINDQRYYLSYSYPLQVVIVLPIDFYQINTVMVIIQMEQYDQLNPPFLINKNEIVAYDRELKNNLFLRRDLIQESIPFQILKIERDGRIISFQYQTRGFQCKYNNKVPYYNLWLIENENNIQVLILELKYTIQIYICSQGILINNYKIPLHQNYISTIVNRNYVSLYTIHQNEFQFYQFIDMNLISQSITIQENIIKIIKNQNNIQLVLDNCKIIELYFNSIPYNIQYFYYNYDNCTEIRFILNQKLVITHNQIRQLINQKINSIINLPYNVYQVSLNKNNQSSLVLIFYEYQDMITISLYFWYQNTINKLYDLPLYNYQIKIPINFQYQESILLLLTQNNQSDNFLFIYNCSNISLKSLLWIIKLDNTDQQNFGFINSKLDFFYLRNRSIVIENINNIHIKYEDYQNYSYPFFSSSIFNLILESQLSLFKQQTNIKIKQYSLNTNQLLILLKDDFIKIDSNGYIDLINIQGLINQIVILESTQQELIHPLTIYNSNELSNCLYYTNHLCIQSHSVIMFQYLKQIYKFQLDKSINHQCQIYFDKKYKTYHIMQIVDINEQKLINFIKIQFEIQSINGKVSINKIQETYYSILMIEIQQIVKIEGLIILISDSFNSNLIIQKQFSYEIINFKLSYPYNTFDAYFIKNGTYFFMAGDNQQLQLKVITFNLDDLNLNYETLFSQELQFLEIFQNMPFIQFELQLNFIKIKTVHLKNNSLIIQAILFFYDTFFVFIEIHYDFVKQILIQTQIVSIFKYADSSKFHQLLYLDENFIIIKVSTNTSRSSLLIYDLSYILEKKEIDAIYLFQDNNYTTIERYNQTHHVMLKFDKDILQIKLIQLQKYQIKCINQCNLKLKLLLQNDFSSIIVKTIDQNDVPLVNYQQIIVFICLLCIIYLTIHRKKRMQPI
ncbi:unnamed protein product [Paramecium primaurelia]|uniref:Transmembrane protein n=1 Tax=Paramecium primaurelia TaxID=5886 RepID=A0A8S1QGB3_PARPR|nr:unnamed protein product [Paramecium primaurelia]